MVGRDSCGAGELRALRSTQHAPHTRSGKVFLCEDDPATRPAITSAPTLYIDTDAHPTWTRDAPHLTAYARQGRSRC